MSSFACLKKVDAVSRASVCTVFSSLPYLKADDSCAGETIVVVSHGGFLSCLYQHIMQARYREAVHNCSIGEILVSGTTMALVSWNQPTKATADAAPVGQASGFGGSGFG